MIGLCSLVILANAAIFALGVYLWNLWASPEIRVRPGTRNKLILFAVLIALIYCLFGAFTFLRAVPG